MRRWPRGWAAVSLGLGGAILAAVLGLGLRVNLSPSAPRGLYRAVAGGPTRSGWVMACVSPEAAALRRGRGYLAPGRCAGGVQPVLKPIVAIVGDPVDLAWDGLAVSGQCLPGSLSADVDSAGRALSHPGPQPVPGGARQALAGEHAGGEQLVQPVLGADHGVADPRGGAPRMDRRVMPGAVGAAAPEVRR